MMLFAAHLPPPVPRAELVLSVDRSVVRPGENPGYHATIVNRGETPLRLMTLQDGSSWEYANPLVSWSTPDAPPPVFIGRCGTTNPPGPDSFFTLKPGGRKEISLGWADAPRLSSGKNRIAFGYRIDPKVPMRMFTVDGDKDRSLARRYTELTPIKVRSNTLVVTLTKAP